MRSKNTCGRKGIVLWSFSVDVLIFFLLITLLISSIACASPLKVGVILPLTGNAASYGAQFKRGLELAASNNSSLQFIFEDSRFDSTTALTALRKLIDIDHIDALFSFGGATCEVLNHETQRRRLLHLASGCNTATFNTPDSFNFRLDVNEQIAAAKTAEYLTGRGLTRIAFLYADNSWAGTIIKFTRQALAERGISISSEITFPEDSSLDIRSSLSRLKSTHPQLIFLISLPELTPIVLRQLNQAGLKIPVMSNISVENPEVVRLAGALADGITYLSVKAQPASRQRFAEFYRIFPEGNPFAAWGHDSVLLLQDAVKHPSPQHFMLGLQNFPGAFNTYNYDNLGELGLAYEIREIKGGKFVSKASL